jgi:hypothetical protein
MVRLRVCDECCADLEANRGGRRIPGPHVIDLDTRCEAHGRIGALAASRVVEVFETVADDLVEERALEALAPLDAYRGDQVEDAPIVAQLAVSLMNGQAHEPTDDAIAISVRVARRVLHAARGK